MPAVNARSELVATEQRPRVFIDLTTSLTLYGRQAMGILRTEREIARRLLQEPRIVPIPFVFSSGRIFAVDRADALKLVETSSAIDGSTARLHAVGHETLPPIRPGLRWLRWLARRGLAAIPVSIREDMRLVLIHSREIVRKTFRAHRPVQPPDVRDESMKASVAIRNRSIEIGWPDAGEALWTCGHYGAVVPLRIVAEARQRRGFSCVAICYDLIRNNHPEWNPDTPHRALYDCVAIDLLDAADRVLCTSEYTRARLLEFAAKSGRGVPDARVLALGCDLPAVAPNGALPQEIAGRRYALSVGSVERRKNYGILIRAWETLSNDPDFDLDLVIVGRAAEWDTGEVLELEGSPLLGRTIFWFEECSDDIFSLLYRRADVLLYPSFAEGWGLPVSEGLAFGTPVVASRAGAIPEAASGFATLVDPYDECAWRKAIKDVAASAPPKLSRVQPPVWEATATAIASHLVEIARRPVA